MITTNKKKIGWLALAAILIANGFFLNFNAFRGLNFFDMGAFLDASWRVLTGQKPYIDFQFLSGPIHLYMNALFFLFFGFGKSAILAHLITVNSIVIVSTFLAARRFLPLLPTFLCTLLSSICFYGPISFPWYDQSAQLWGIIALTVLILKLPLEDPKNACRIGFLTGILTVLSFMTKSNLGAGYGAIFFLTFLCVRTRWKALAGYAAGLSLATIAMLAVIGSPTKYIDQAFLAFDIPVQRLRRFLPLLFIPTWFADYYWLTALLVYLNVRSHLKSLRAIFTIFVGVFLLSIFASWTGSMKSTANIPLMGIYITLAFILIAQTGKQSEGKRMRTFHSASKWAMIGLAIFLIFTSAKRSLALDAWTYGNLDPFGNYAMQSAPIRGWMAHKQTGEAVDALTEFIKKNVPKNQSLLILTDLQILYPLTERESYKGVSFIFTVNEVPPPGKRVEELKNYILAHPPQWIVTHRNQNVISFVAALIPYLGLEEFVTNFYYPVFITNDYVLLKHN